MDGYHWCSNSGDSDGHLVVRMSNVVIMNNISYRIVNCIFWLKHNIRRNLSFSNTFNEEWRPFDGSLLINPQKKNETVRILKENYPQAIKRTIQDAEDICKHRFKILGLEKVQLDRNIEWNRDFLSKKRWESTPAEEISVIYNEGADIKVPWELSRFYHAVTLGEAYWLTGEDKFLKEFVQEIKDWLEKNHLGIGVNWVCPMEAAIRVANWLIGLNFFYNSPLLEASFLNILLCSVINHGRYIYKNLEYGLINANHLIADLVGLLYIGVGLRSSEYGRYLILFSLQEIARQLRYQIYRDGSHFEASTCYHKLVLEFLTFTYLLCIRKGISLPKSFPIILKKMFKVVRNIVKPDGTVPIVGDNDSGRFHIFYPHEDRDFLYLLDIGAILFNEPEFKIHKRLPSPEVVWLFGRRGLEKWKEFDRSYPAHQSSATPDSGWYVMRNNNFYVAICCGPNGQAGKGGHAHNDKLSFELNVCGMGFVVDPGTCTYTRDRKERDTFRGTRAHNTVIVDGEEQNRFRDTFALFNDARVKVIEWESKNEKVTFTGEHSGYKRLKGGIIHRRNFSLENSTLTITDEIKNSKPDSTLHNLEWNFHCHPEVEILQSGEVVYLIRRDGEAISLKTSHQENLHWKVVNDWVCFAYGEKKSAKVLRYEREVTLPFKLRFFLQLCERSDRQ